MKRRAGEREKKLKVPSFFFLLPLSPEERARAEPSLPRCCKARGAAGASRAGAAGDPREGPRSRRQVNCAGEVTPAPDSLPRLGCGQEAAACLQGGCRGVPSGAWQDGRSGSRTRPGLTARPSFAVPVAVVQWSVCAQCPGAGAASRCSRAGELCPG